MSLPITVSEAKALLKKHIPIGSTQLCPIRLSNGKVLAKNTIAPMDVPSFDNSAMDGYALAWEDDGESREVLGLVAAGDSELKSLQKGEAARIFTGAPIPPGADTVIQQEKIIRTGNKIQFERKDFRPGASVRLRGAQCKKGDEILQVGSRVNPGTIALLASLGIAEVEVYNLPKVALIVTGNELREVGQQLNPGQIYNSSGPAIQAYLDDLGVKDVQIFHAEDDFEKVILTIREALKVCDFLLLTGGISVGDFDFVKDGLSENGVEEIFYKISQRPGKPLFAGKKEGKIVFALPGNPASVLTCFLNYVKPSILQWAGHSDSWRPSLILPLADLFTKSVNLTLFLKAKIENGKVQILPGQESFNLLSFGQADGLAEIPMDSEFLEAGMLVSFYSW
jgi:molybdopterin molybdotransferase